MFIQSFKVCRRCTSLHRQLEIHAALCTVQAKNKTMLKRQSTPEVHLGERGSAGCRGVSLTRRSESGWTRMAGHVFTCMFGARPRGIASLLARPPCCARSPFSGVRRHSAGVSSNLVQEALRGVFFLGGGGGGITHQVPGHRRIQT